MIPHVGIDLGTTFCCVSYINNDGVPVIIKNNDGEETTPSVIWFDGKMAYVGKKANTRKLQANSPIFEFVKRSIGKETGSLFKVNGYDYRACGMSAIILKKLKTDIFFYFKRMGLLSPADTIDNSMIPAVITVPAYFGDKQRHETKMAGIAAGFDVLAIVNEPTAAALTYGMNLNQPKKLLVFDLGGGTFDVTILQLGNNEAAVIASDGADRLGGRDWDALIENYFNHEFERQTGAEIPDDMGWELQKMALDNKFLLSEQTSAPVFINAAGKSVEITTWRERPDEDDLITGNTANLFYFEERSASLLTLCRSIMSRMLDKAKLKWADIDDIVLAGGASRMPMIAKMLAAVSGRSIHKNIPGFSLDTAIAQGAALYGRNRSRVVDVSPKSIGIEVTQDGRKLIEHLVKKNTPLPISIKETFPADANAVLKVYEGDSTNPEECDQRGRLELGNAAGNVSVGLTIDESGVVHASVEGNGVKAALRIISEQGDIDVHELKEKIDLIDIRI
jgi:molecular chaperone DnaK